LPFLSKPDTVLRRRQIVQKEKMRPVVLIGPPGCGKTTLGELAAQKLGIAFVDTDTQVIQRVNSRYPESHFFEIVRHFPALEYEVLLELVREQKPMVLSTGAETALSPEKASLLTQIGYIVLVRRNKETLTEELSRQKSHWVMTTGEGEHKKTENASGFFTDMFFNEMPCYERIANAVLDNDSGIETGLAGLITIINAIPEI
jgi:shikimate kinase